LQCSGGTFSNNGGYAIDAENAEIRQNAMLNTSDIASPFQAEGQVSLNSATIKGGLTCLGGFFSNSNGIAFSGIRFSVADDVILGDETLSQDGEADPPLLRSEVMGEVSLVGANVGGSFKIQGGRFQGAKLDVEGQPVTSALDARNMTVNGNVEFTHGAQFAGVVRLDASTVQQTLICHESTFDNPGSDALTALDLRVNGSVFFQKRMIANGVVDLTRASFGSGITINSAQFNNARGVALNGQGMRVQGKIQTGKKFQVSGQLRLEGATLHGGAEMLGKLRCSNAPAIFADNLVAHRSVTFLKCCDISGGLRMVRATIHGDLNIYSHVSQDSSDQDSSDQDSSDQDSSDQDSSDQDSSDQDSSDQDSSDQDPSDQDPSDQDPSDQDPSDQDPSDQDPSDQDPSQKAEQKSLMLDSIDVRGSLFLKGDFDGLVNVIGAKIGGDVDCTNGIFNRAEGDALLCDGSTTEGSVLMMNLTINGRASFAGTSVSRYFAWENVESPEGCELDVSNAEIDTFVDEPDAWPESGKLILDGLTYNNINLASRRLEWLRLQGDFHPQPYVQLASFLRTHGDDQGAVTVLIEKENDRARLTQMSWLAWCRHRLLGFSIGYGYQPWNAFWFVCFEVILGTIVFSSGNRRNLFRPTKDDDRGYPAFQALIYSFDSFAPLIDLHQATYWLPGADRGRAIPAWMRAGGTLPALTTGGLLRIFLWFHIVSGWTVTTLLAAGLSGLIKK
jgi:hypothetical protein